jgi:repressor LexA
MPAAKKTSANQLNGSAISALLSDKVILMKSLTEKQKAMLEFIEDFQDRESMAPTVYEIAEHFGVKTSTVFAHLKALERKNQLQRSSKARSINLQNRKQRNTVPHMSIAMPIPLLGRINAGEPAESREEIIGEIIVAQTLLAKFNASPEDVFALRVSGESMRDLGICEDDILIIKRTDNVRPGDIVVALVGGDVTVKSYFPLRNGMLELRPANCDFRTQIYKAEEVSVQGRVISLQRQF